MRETWGKEVNYSEEENDSEGKMGKKKVRRVLGQSRGSAILMAIDQYGTIDGK